MLANDDNNKMLTNIPTYRLWSEKFMKGMHNRIGGGIRPHSYVH